ncbi:MAG: amidohydrolase family protein [Theionarchaea archaeon]|nr:amidohydrolase family protein [Theionarchaea archaeon]
MKFDKIDGFVCLADRLFDGHQAREDCCVVVRGSMIEAILPVDRVPSELPSIEMPGCTILPGLIDCHVHFMRWQGPLFLAGGITTVRDTGNDLDWILARRAEWPDHDWPRILCTGPMVDGPRSSWGIGRCCPDLESSVNAVMELASRGVDAIKLYAQFPRDWLPGVVAAARDVGLPTCMHPIATDALDAAEAGVDELFHLDGLMKRLWPGHPPGWLELWGDPNVSGALDRQREVVDLIAKTGTVITPTLSFYRSRLGTVGDPELLPECAQSWFSKVFEEPGEDELELWRSALPSVQGFVGLLHQRSVPILAGTDVPWALPGRSLWTELSLLSESGLGPVGALRSATSISAEQLRLPQAGVLEAGRCADIAFVMGDPTSSIPEEPEIPLIIRGGKVHWTEQLVTGSREENANPALDPWGMELIQRSRALRDGE